jgi:hypothetical protein
MDVRRESRHEVIEALRRRYRGAGRAEKGRLIDEAAAVTGDHRRYAQALLRAGVPYGGPRLQRGGRPRVYGRAVVQALRVAAEATGWICGKRLVAALPDLVPALEQEGALHLTAEERNALLGMSAATIDRRLAEGRRVERPRGVATSKPGSLLKSQIPLRTDTPWDEQAPGFVELDLVAHCGATTAGEYVCTLTLVDIATGWTECAAIANKGQRAVLAALGRLRARLPFPLRGVDCDNGSEFRGAHLVRYCQAERLTLTRCRAYHKNDQAHVEQKNWSVVRQLVGYDRYEGAEAVAALEGVYDLLPVYVNGYLPVMKLVGKERDGARVRKHYEAPQTPYRRAEAAGVLQPDAPVAFAAQLAAAGPLHLRRQLDAALAQVWARRVGAAAPTRPGAVA